MLSWKVRLGGRERERERKIEKTRKMTKNAAKFSREVRIHVIFPLKGTRHLFRKFQRIIKLPEYLNRLIRTHTFHFLFVLLSLSLSFSFLSFFFLYNERVIKIF